jgi:hypothetical protein
MLCGGEGDGVFMVGGVLGIILREREEDELGLEEPFAEGV